ncbi:glucosyltransferase domain-containing protein [Pseudomonas entomophila]|uniref:glucosyltransferase domain-containing protein n=1 Tax=Pseudomonas entomophila TaxID=312306 RepID=UPI00200BFAFB|nr:glucosyltransferase domain-containing protein [Pseudomonas entomophila]
MLPLILADLPYIDDIWRAQLAGRIDNANDSWTGQGRVLADVFHAVLGFGNAAPDLFPLPLMLASVITAKALAGLVTHYFETPRLASLLVVLPLWYNPFFLQNLSYQYDAPLMALSLAASIVAITLGAQNGYRVLAGMLLVAVAASLYQISINLFAGLCCIEAIRLILAGTGLRQVSGQALMRIAQLAGGCALYLLTGYQLITVPRTQMLPLDQAWPLAIMQRLETTAEHVGLLITPGTAWFFVGLSMVAFLSLMQAVYRLFRADGHYGQKLGLVAVLMACLVAVVLLVPGMSLLFADFNCAPRLLMGLGPAMVLVALLAYRLLAEWHEGLAWALAIPLVFMLSFSYAYGRVLVAQKELEQLVTFSISRAIQASPALSGAHRFYLHDYDPKRVWLPAASGSFQAMPALKYVLSIGYQVLPEMMPRVGLPEFGSVAPLTRDEVLARSPVPKVDERFFSIYLVDEVGYVVIKSPDRWVEYFK